MTKEQAIDVIKCLAWHARPDEEKIEQAIETLNQPTSDYCVSIEEVLKQIKEWRDCEFVKMTNPYHYLEKRIQSMSPVTPTQCIAAVRFSKEDLKEICNERIEIECTHGTCEKCIWKHIIGEEEDEFFAGFMTCKRLNILCNKDFYCKYFDKGDSEDGSN